MNKGAKVRFTEASDEQVNWSGNDDPRKVLELGGEYIIEKADVYPWHTDVTLKEFPGLRFNSVHFEEIDAESEELK